MELIKLIDLPIIDVRISFNFMFNFFNLDNNVPGPNAYKNFSLIGRSIFDSRYKSPSFISMSQKFRIIDRNEKNPGPGSYIRFSEFGILNPKKNLYKEKEKRERKRSSEEKKNSSPHNDLSQENSDSS